jgi:hypothetical protein
MQAMRLPAQAFAAVFDFSTRAGAGRFYLLGRNRLRIKEFFLGFLFFFFWENRIIRKLPKKIENN